MTQEIIPEQHAPDLSAKGIWQRLPDESANAHAAFAAFLQLGPDATLEQAAQASGRTVGAIRNLSYRHHWQDRASAWRQHLATVALTAIETDHTRQARLWNIRQQSFREQQWEAIQQMLTLSRQVRLQLLNQQEHDIEYYEFVRLEEQISKLGKLAFPASKADGADPTLNPDTDPIILRFREHLRKAVGREDDPPAQTPPSS